MATSSRTTSVAVRDLAPSTLAPEVQADRTILDRVSSWIARHDRLDEVQREWQQLESALFAKAATLKISCDAAMRGNLAEAKDMRALDAEIEASHRDLAVEAGEIRAMKSSSVADALAKVELGLSVQGPFDWRDHARQLIADGIEELKSMLEDIDRA